MSVQIDSNELVVARQPGTRLFLAGVSGAGPVFEGPSHRTIFFEPHQAESELRRMRVPAETVELKPARMKAQLG